jgi:tRNA dimethylallyltransferase
MSTAQKIIVVAGPTASGKSNLALALAESQNGVVINADSMQVYKDIPILAAAPTAKDTARAPHRLYGIYDASVHSNVVEWLKLCEAEIKQTLEHNQTPIVTGGTGMYIEALVKGVTPIPETPAAIKHQIGQMLKTDGLEAMYRLLNEKDPETAARLSENDTTRIRRALEILYHTGKGLSYWYTVPLIAKFAPEDFVTVYLNTPRDILDIRARIRFDKMMEMGALAEAEKLIARNLPDSLPAMRALGVQEFKSFFKNECLLPEAIELAKLHTRQYAKRQTTWFNNRFQADFRFCDCFSEDKNFVDVIKKSL